MENPLPPTPYQYQVGGSLEYQHPTYVVRQADCDLYEGLKNAEFCYVLNSRQMGKSSLRVQMMKKLKEQGIKCASIDMTRIGSYVTPSEWYAGVISELLRGFGLSRKVNFSDWWRDHDSLPPLQRLRELIEDVLLAEFSQNLVIFIDEIDCILKVKFKDDFFGFIRACYNQRVDNLEYQRLTFCLLGVATPSDLIADKQRTPFNIGRAIELTGFKLEEAILALTEGLAHKVDNPGKVVEEVLYWTDGQPFLTQKLCQLVVEKAETSKPKIDELVQQYLIDNWQAQDEPEHLKTIRDRLLSNEQNNSRVLGLYQQILQQGEVAADESPEQIELRLSGMVVKQQGCLRVYNRIYQAVFDLSWVEKELAALRPYSQAIAAWLASNRQDSSRLLRGQALQDARVWSTGKNLSVEDYQFLTASQDREFQEVQVALRLAQIALEAEQKANQMLREGQQKMHSPPAQQAQPTRHLPQFQQDLHLQPPKLSKAEALEELGTKARVESKVFRLRAAVPNRQRTRFKSFIYALKILRTDIAISAIVSVVSGGLIYGIIVIFFNVPHQLTKTIAICLSFLFFTILIIQVFWEKLDKIRLRITHKIDREVAHHSEIDTQLEDMECTQVEETALIQTEYSQGEATALIQTEYFQDLQQKARQLRVQSSLPLNRLEGSTEEEFNDIEDERDDLS